MKIYHVFGHDLYAWDFSETVLANSDREAKEEVFEKQVKSLFVDKDKALNVKEWVMREEYCVEEVMFDGYEIKIKEEALS